MKEYLFLFHSTVGVIQTRKALQAAGMTFRVTDIPRDLRGGCGLCIWLSCPAGEERQWVLPGQTEAIYCQQDGSWHCIAHDGNAPR
ncbi:DUF3343 domain-containing protein [Escherichia coli]|uniref:DUF3343 domain-containing protein n=1 Tax=Escherichia coli TaxID=562 RepID=UPI00142F5475|nr:DUF3343 domain-containing protein [Escherichia coli]EHB7662367.1 DUF3343 domain-containing protein [Escherichia coli]EII9936723.1 DUF3343 domain-containing protein [Escherichia coli]EJE3861532.1 DUF3343 domain-containing protein [Escherichia coli]EJZ1815377.1 DUF3343 domain-containing protein [Escherichia coli]